MNRVQGKLIKLAEEASEITKEAMKAALLPGRPYNGVTPECRLREEVIDLIICVRILQKLGVIGAITEADVRETFLSKHAKIGKYTEISCKLGALHDSWVPSLEDVI